MLGEESAKFWVFSSIYRGVNCLKNKSDQLKK